VEPEGELTHASPFSHLISLVDDQGRVATVVDDELRAE